MLLLPDVTVIVPTYNRASVFAAIDSVLRQRGAVFDLIVIDDGSTDETWRELEHTAAHANENAIRGFMRIVRTDHRGVAAARNTGVAMASTELIAFLDSDDLWEPDKLARQLDFMREHREYAISQTEERWLHKGSFRNPGARHRKCAGDIFVESLRTCLISPSAVIMRRDLFEEMGGFDEDLTAAEDYDLWLRILLDHEVGLLGETHVTRHAGHKGQLSATIPALDRFRILTLMALLARSELSPTRREAVCDVLAEKCAIYAKGLICRKRDERAAFILGVRELATREWRDHPCESLRQNIDQNIEMMRAILRAERSADLAALDDASR
jgi:glycosyltransferase involved in cell wall biosynthesis